MNARKDNPSDGFSTKSLKGKNLKWMVACVVFDIALLVLLTHALSIKDLLGSKIFDPRAGLTLILPFPLTLLANMISANNKARMVFWTWRNPLPGSRAFTLHGPADARIDMAVLTHNVGTLPTDEREQNVVWYRLSKQAEKDVPVRDSHQLYLLFRDIAAMSLLLVVVATLLLCLIQESRAAAPWAAGVFFVQFVIAAIAARNCGVRFVQNVLVFHSLRKIPKRSNTASSASSTGSKPRKARAKAQATAQENTTADGSEERKDSVT